MPQPLRKRSDNLVTMATGNQLVSVANSDIARRAYELYEARGGEHAHDVNDWLKAGQELRSVLSSTAA